MNIILFAFVLFVWGSLILSCWVIRESSSMLADEHA